MMFVCFQPDGIPKYLYHLCAESGGKKTPRQSAEGEQEEEVDDDNICGERHSRYYKFLYLFAQLSFAVFI